MIWSWLGISIVTLAVAYSLAEICSAYPVAGGQLPLLQLLLCLPGSYPTYQWLLTRYRPVLLGCGACSSEYRPRSLIRDGMVYDDRYGRRSD
jgi:hypothetical protein